MHEIKVNLLAKLASLCPTHLPGKEDDEDEDFALTPAPTRWTSQVRRATVGETA